ncbi:MAG TPA: ATP synthase F1 subunit delta [Firmicutes bacterium]|nr:ATP synthase F1 subunit delta [Bacillota bacterium]
MSLVERRYAASLLELAEDRDLYEPFYRELKMASNIIHKNERLESFLLDLQVDSSKKKKVIFAVFNGNIMQELINFLNVLIDKNRFEYLDPIIEEFRIMADQKQNILNVTVVSAFPIDELQLQEIKRKCKNKYMASKVRVHLQEDKSLLGGIKLKIGDTMIDGTVKSRLEELRKTLLQ